MGRIPWKTLATWGFLAWCAWTVYQDHEETRRAMASAESAAWAAKAAVGNLDAKVTAIAHRVGAD